MMVPQAAWPQGGTPVGPEFRVNTYTTNDQITPAVAASSLGDFVVVWSTFFQDGSGRAVMAQRYANSGAPLGSEFRVNTYTYLDQAFPGVATDGAGDFVVVWSSNTQDGSSTGVFGQRYASLGVPAGPEFPVNTYTTGSQSSPSVAASAAGNFIVVWDSVGQDGAGFGVFGQRYAAAGAPLGQEFRVNTYTTAGQRAPVVAADAAGNFVVVWTSYFQDGAFYGIFGQRYASSGAPVGPEFRVNTYTTNDQLFPAVASDGAGDFVIVWYSNTQDGSSTGVFGQRYAFSGVPAGPEFRVNTFTTGFQRFPSVAADASGDFVVSWEAVNQDGSTFGVFGQRYVAAGAPLGAEFRVNTYTTNLQIAPSVAADSAGDFVVVWTSQQQDGSSYGVFGQRYSPIVPVELMHFRVE
jgi:hypothetical protein